MKSRRVRGMSLSRENSWPQVHLSKQEAAIPDSVMELSCSSTGLVFICLFVFFFSIP